jgi:uncharacterized protein YjgD (DUF1641 family)
MTRGRSMANPIEFKPRVDPKRELQKQLDAAPLEHAEELLVVYDILKVAHANGTLDLIGGLAEGRDVIAGKLAEYAKLPGGVAAIRNLLALGKILMAFDPETLDNLTKHLVTVTGQYRAEGKPPSMWQLAKRATSEDSRRGLSFMTMLLGAVGRSVAPSAESKR